MAKELTPRAEELKDLGWSQDDVLRYAELWDYRQRWGAINLEREDRQFLRQAESALPKLVSGKVSAKKPTQEKSYYLWLSFYLERMISAEKDFKLSEGSIGAWRLLIEEELRVLDYYEPVLGLPDTIKAKSFFKAREELIKDCFERFQDDVKVYEFDFQKPIEDLKGQEGRASWKPLRGSDNGSDRKSYLVLSNKIASTFREQLRNELPKLISSTFPSLSETEKPLPPHNWCRD